jgi:hypothetical protein
MSHSRRKYQTLLQQRIRQVGSDAKRMTCSKENPPQWLEAISNQMYSVLDMASLTNEAAKIYFL